ncbi:VOC family protein [Oceanicola sp. D3]|uniref:VOC family protein n=1 Tax=Oceanicola sp. D3 TaxID=2587163 RepID=UPI00352C9D73
MTPQSIAHIALVVRDYEDLKAKGVTFERAPKKAPYGTVAVFRDLYGTLWDLVQFSDGAR